MKKNIQSMLALAVAAGALALSGCASQRPDSATLYDLGPVRLPSAQAPLPALPALSVAEISMPAWLDRPLMLYRLNYKNDLQPRSYAHSRWTMPPGQLISHRLKARIAQAGGVVLSASDGALNMPVLRIEADDFMQTFDAPGQSVGRLALRASLFKRRALIAQKTFSSQVQAASADADGGARALAQASDAAITELMHWLASLPLK